MTQMKKHPKTQKTQKSQKKLHKCFFLQITKIWKRKYLRFKPIKIKTHSAPQMDRLNLSFVKYIYVDARTLARNGRKTTILVANFGYQSLYDMDIK